MPSEADDDLSIYTRGNPLLASLEHPGNSAARISRYDVAVVGAGPAGLMTAVRAASDGLRVVLLDARELGGKIRSNPRIENHFGAPALISGRAWTRRVVARAVRLGVEARVPVEVTSLQNDGTEFLLEAAQGPSVRARSVVVATGVHERGSPRTAVCDGEGYGVSDWVSRLHVRYCLGEEVAVIAGSEAAVETALWLAGFASRVWLLVCDDNLERRVSSHWLSRIEGLPNLALRSRAELIALEPRTRGQLARIEWWGPRGREERRVREVFVLDGIDAATDWLRGCEVALDASGFVRTSARPGDRKVTPLRTSVPGLFAVGDVRAGSVKRLDVAMREGALVAAELSDFLIRPPA